MATFCTFQNCESRAALSARGPQADLSGLPLPSLSENTRHSSAETRALRSRGRETPPIGGVICGLLAEHSPRLGREPKNARLGGCAARLQRTRLADCNSLICGKIQRISVEGPLPAWTIRLKHKASLGDFPAVGTGNFWARTGNAIAPNRELRMSAPGALEVRFDPKRTFHPVLLICRIGPPIDHRFGNRKVIPSRPPKPWGPVSGESIQ